MVSKKVKRMMLGIFLFFTICLGVYLFYTYSQLQKMIEPIETTEMFGPIETTEKPAPSLSKTTPISVLLLGIDQLNKEPARSDAMIVLTLNPEDQTTKMVSIPRDTLTKIVGKGYGDKINHAYAFGGASMSVKTVENFLDIPIDYYASINLKGLTKLVEVLGSITVENKFEFQSHDGNHTYPKGKVKLTNDNIEDYIRMRYDDPNGDFGRQERQRQVVTKLIDKSLSINTLPKLNKIINLLGNNVRTNAKPLELLKMAKHYKPALTNQEVLQFKGTNSKINGIYYYITDEASKQDIKNQLKKELK